jgi:hypothetical protein
MSVRKWLASLIGGPPRISDSEDDPAEVEDDLAEEMPDAAEDAKEAEESQEVPTRVGVKMRVSPLLPGPPTTVAFEEDKDAASERAGEESDQSS